MGIHATYDPGRPDWVMLGTPYPDGKVAPYASKSLNHAELRVEMDQEDIRVWDRFDPIRTIGRERYTITAETSDFVLIIADDYDSAFRGLWDHWQPTRARRPEVEARRELPRGAPIALPGAPPRAIESGP